MSDKPKRGGILRAVTKGDIMEFSIAGRVIGRVECVSLHGSTPRAYKARMRFDFDRGILIRPIDNPAQERGEKETMNGKSS